MKTYKKLFIILALLTMMVLPGFTLELEVDYLEGVLEIRESGASWTMVDIGDQITKNATLRLSDQGYVEISSEGQRVTLTKDGTYQAKSLFPHAGSSYMTVGKRLRKTLGARFAALSTDVGAYSGTAVGGVRGAQATQSNSFSWETENVDYLSVGKELFQAENYAAALKLFEEGVIWESGAVKRECLFRAGLSQSLLGGPREARMTMEKVNPKTSDPFFGEYAVTMGTLLIESREYNRAEDLLASYLKMDPKGETAQTAHLIKAYSHLNQGDEAGFRMELTKSHAMNPGSEIGVTAKQLLES